MKAIDERGARTRTTSRTSKAGRRSIRFAQGFLALAVGSGLLILIDLGGVVTTLAKGLFFLFTILSLYFTAIAPPSEQRGSAS